MEQIYLQNRFHDRQLQNRLKMHIFYKKGHCIIKGERRNIRLFQNRKKVAISRYLPQPLGASGKSSERILLLRLRGAHRKNTCSTIYIHSTHNNTLYTFINSAGETKCCVSTGMCGFKNARKATAYASQAAAEKLAALTKHCNVKGVAIKMSGLGPGKYSGVRALNRFGFRLVRICEENMKTHNGCRPPQRRRI